MQSILSNQAASPYRLMLASTLMLFIELMLIRWIGSNVYYIFFFTNFILLSCFLGMSIAFLRAKNSTNWFHYSPMLLTLIVTLGYVFSYQYQVKINPNTDNLDYAAVYFKQNLYPVWLTLPIIFCSVTALMASISSEVARLFSQFKPLNAYRLEVLGSLVGIIIFSLFSLLHLKPISWGFFIILLYLPMLINEFKNKHYLILAFQIVMLSMMMLIFNFESSLEHHWSSYSKIEAKEFSGKRYAVNVNGLPQQIIESVEQRKKVKPFYLVPYQQAGKQIDDVLVIGSGTGGDVALALSQGVKHVDAVEIDAMLYQLGKKLNVDHPYDDARVKVYIDDGRAFLERNHKKYDMIIFALTDSLQLVSGQSSLRLENYLYTKEGLTVASAHLKPNGIFTIYNHYSVQWLIDRLANTLTQVYGHTPCLTSYGRSDHSAIVLNISHNVNALNCKTWQSSGNDYEAPITDDHPFMYLQESTIPTLYTISLLLILLMTFSLLRLFGISYSSLKEHSHLFFMGGAFFLLETKNIINYALFFGTTWFVNALVFMGILLTVYLSIEVNYRYEIKNRLLCYLGLMLFLVIAWLTPNSWLLQLSIPLRFIAATSLAFAPIFIANLIFGYEFRKTIQPTAAFGANLLGAVLGGLLEYSSLVVGYHNVLIIVMSLYVLANT